MGIASIDSVVEPAAADDQTKTPTKESTPTYLSGESLTFPLITGVGTAAITMWAALRDTEPTANVVVTVAIICGILVTIWGVVDANAASTEKKKLTSGDLFKRTVIGVLNTVLLAAALWGTVAAAQEAFGTA
jgi:hypothetical protein